VTGVLPCRITALVRAPTDELVRCELTHLERQRIDVHRARTQHRRYVEILNELGADIAWLPSLPPHPDAVFVEDMAIVLSEIAVIARSGAPSRRGEAASVAEALSAHRPLRWVEPPGNLDGGDVLRIGRSIWVGCAGRTDADGVTALASAVSEFDYEVRAVVTRGCLHLKSACSFIPPDTVLANPRWIDCDLFKGLNVIAVDEREPHAANSLTVAATTMVSAAYPFTADKLRRAGIRTVSLDVSELHKAEAGLTCMSLIIPPITVSESAAPVAAG
jgi:dimethylargininase